jgi:hypothetical protein
MARQMFRWNWARASDTILASSESEGTADAVGYQGLPHSEDLLNIDIDNRHLKVEKLLNEAAA